MLHLVLYGLLAVIVAVGLFLLATRFLPAGEQIAPPLRDEPPWDLPPGRALQAADIDAVRLPVALRGYRFAETDVLLDRLAGELRTRDEEIARLKGHVVQKDSPTEFDEADGVDSDSEQVQEGHERYSPPPPTAPPYPSVYGPRPAPQTEAPQTEEPQPAEPHRDEPSDPDQPGAGRS